MGIENPGQMIPDEEESENINSPIDPDISLHTILDQIKEADEATLRKIHKSIGDKTLFPIIRGEELKRHTLAKRAAVKKRAEELGIDLFV